MRSSNLLRFIANRRFSTSRIKLDAAYDGPGKTTIDILNESDTRLLVDGFSQYGFLLNNGLRAMGPIAIFPDAVFQWKIKDTLSVNADSFKLFEIVHPKPDIIIFGFGSPPQQLETNFKKQIQRDYLKQRNKVITNIIFHMRKHKINIDCMPTENAVGAYNYMVNEGRLACAALIPPELVTMTSASQKLDSMMKNEDFNTTKGELVDFTSFDSEDRREVVEELTDFKDSLQTYFKEKREKSRKSKKPEE